MTDDLVFSAAEVVKRLECGGWTINSAGRPDVLALDSGHYFANGDGVSVLLRLSGMDALVSDGGVMKHRLLDAQVDIKSERVRQAWDATLQDFGLHEAEDRVVGRRPVERAESLLGDLVDAMLTLDGFKVLAKRAQPSRLERQLYTFLSDLADAKRLRYERHPTVLMPAGTKVQPTAKVETPERDVYLQTATKDTLGRATYVTAALRQARFDVNQRLVVLKGRRADWSQDHLDLLTPEARVGFMDETWVLRQLLIPA